ncbi:hypothetical protein PR048_010686 [Dryococelus australis]|uniref:Uncharacterized protein n=1 Tax=Dryococelus australis TaxID=614101 RepID=A0ABQ9I479_9NEOP|nr:hypothetical protein PR048_010686 [Dryococelus australis]
MVMLIVCGIAQILGMILSPQQPPPAKVAGTALDNSTTERSITVPTKEASGGGDTWRHREQELCRTIQHLAEENMRLATTRREVECKMARMDTAHMEDRNTIAKLGSNIVALTEELAGLRKGENTQLQRRQAVEEAVQVEVECKLKSEQQIESLLQQNEEHLREIDCLRTELRAKCEALESISVQLLHEKEVGRSLLAEAEKLKTELQNMSTTNTCKPADSAEQPPESVGVMNSDEVLPQESRSRQASLEREGRVAEDIEKFKMEISMKREARQRAMTAISSEMERLRTELAAERESNKQMKEDLDRIRSEKNCNHDGYEELYQSLESEREQNRQTTTRNECLSSELDGLEQLLTAKIKELEEVCKQFDVEREQYCKKVSSLKEVVSISKQLLSIREKQVDDLQFKLNNIQSLVGDKRETTDEQMNAACSQVAAGLRQEYQTQLGNIKSLKELYDERMKIIAEEKDKLSAEFEEICKTLEAEQKKSGELETEVTNLKLSLSEQEEIMSSVQTQLDTSKDEARDLARELTLINNLFTQMLVSSNGSDIDLDKLTKSLQENHDLISEITLKEDSSELAACLPKLLLELVAEVDKNAQNSSETNTEDTVEEFASNNPRDTKQRPCTSCQESNIGDECGHNIAAEDIALNLPKVWKVLMELLSHRVTPTERPSDSNEDCCYKRVDTPYGPRLAISVSKTFLRLKDLILEKKSLRKELVQLKQLNCHLENRLSEQEQRLSLVSSELHKTWSVVGRMRTQHQQLHNHEKILRYELQQKRKLLTELKQELEYCRETWEMARLKNSQSEAQWHILRKEFASRKKNSNSSLDNSGESGFSDDKEDDSGGEDDRRCGASERCTDACFMPEPSESPPGHVPPNLEVDMSRSGCLEIVPPALGMPLEVPPLVVDVTHEPFLAEEVCPLKSPPTPEFLESSAHITVHDGNSAVDTAVLVECPVEKYCGLECSTISLISLLKQQLSCFSKNLEEITSDFGSDDNHQALQSIFFLPDIKVPYYEQTSDINKIKCANCSKGISPNDAESENISSASTRRKPCSFVSSEFGPKKPTNVENESCSRSNSVVDCPQILPQYDQLLSSTGSESSALVSAESSAEGPVEGVVDRKSERLGRTPEQVLEAREARLRRLEEQCQQLVKKVTNTTNRSVVLSNRLEELHGQYGEPPEPPPYPSMLPMLRIPTSAPPPPPMPHHIPVFRIPITTTQTTTTQTGLAGQSESFEDSVSPTPDT